MLSYVGPLERVEIWIPSSRAFRHCNRHLSLFQSLRKQRSHTQNRHGVETLEKAVPQVVVVQAQAKEDEPEGMLLF